MSAAGRGAEQAANRRVRLAPILAGAVVTLAAAVPLSFFAAAIWTARTYSYSEKLANTGLLLAFGFPILVGLVILAVMAFPPDEGDEQ